MRIFHTADWHLGRLLCQVRLTEDQAYVLEELIRVARDWRPDVFILAGDVYDRAVPPPEAVELLNETLSRLVLELQIPVLAIAGNHDSPDRLQFGSRLFAAQRLHVAGKLARPFAPVVLPDEHGPVAFHLLPYAEPVVVRECLADEAVRDHEAAMQALMRCLHEANQEKMRRVLIGHAFIAGGEECESERPLSVGGSGMVNAACLREFQYVALGHLHRQQQIGSERVVYAGSPLKYSFSEALHHKSVSLVEMAADGSVRRESVALPSRRDVRCVSGHFQELLQGGLFTGNRNDYLQITLLDDGPVLDAKARLQEVYPNLLQVVPGRLALAASGCEPSEDRRREDVHATFARFYQDVAGEPMSQPQAAALQRVLERVEAQQREAVA